MTPKMLCLGCDGVEVMYCDGVGVMYCVACRRAMRKMALERARAARTLLPNDLGFFVEEKQWPT